MNIPEEFYFICVDDFDFVYFAHREGDIYIIEWENQRGQKDMVDYDVKDVLELIEEKSWMIVDESFEKPL